MPEPPAVTRQHLQSRTLRTLSATAVFAGIGIAGTTPAGSLLITDITGSETLAGLTQTSGLVGAATAALVLVRLTERGGRRLALGLGYCVGIVGSLIAIASGVARLAPGLLLGAFLVGWAVAAGFQARFAAVDIAEPATRARQLSFVVWGSTIGSVLGPNLLQPSGHLAQALGLPALTGPYVIAATSLAIACAILTVFLRPDPYLYARQLLRSSTDTQQPAQESKASRNDAGAGNAVVGSARGEIVDGNSAHAVTRPIDAPLPNKPSVRIGLRAIRESSKATLGLSAIAIGHVAMVSIMVMTPVHMKHVEFTLTVIGLVISVHIAGMYAFSPLVGAMTDRIGRFRMIAGGAITLMIAAITAGTAPSHSSTQLGLGLFLLGVGWSMTLIAGSTLLAESIDVTHKTSAQGTSDLVMSSSGAVGGALAGVVIAVFGYFALCMSVLPLLVALLIASLRARD